MKEKLLSLIDEFSKINDEEFYYSLTINYENIVYEFKNEKFILEDVKKLVDDYNGEITSFNLSLNNNGPYSEDRYKSYFYDVKFVFHSEGILLSFSSSYLSNRDISVISISQLKKIYDAHKEASKLLYNKIMN